MTPGLQICPCYACMVALFSRQWKHFATKPWRKALHFCISLLKACLLILHNETPCWRPDTISSLEKLDHPHQLTLELRYQLQCLERKVKFINDLLVFRNVIRIHRREFCLGHLPQIIKLQAIPSLKFEDCTCKVSDNLLCHWSKICEGQSCSWVPIHGYAHALILTSWNCFKCWRPIQWYG